GTARRPPRSPPTPAAALRHMDLVAAASADLAADVPGAGSRAVAVLPCGVDMDRFVPLPRPEARERLGLAPGERHLLLPADPARPGKRADRARAVATATGARLLTLGRVH